MLYVPFSIQLTGEEILDVFFHAYLFEQWRIVRIYQTGCRFNLSWGFGVEEHGNGDPLFCCIYCCPVLYASVYPVAQNLQNRKTRQLVKKGEFFLKFYSLFSVVCAFYLLFFWSFLFSFPCSPYLIPKNKTRKKSKKIKNKFKINKLFLYINLNLFYLF